MNITNTKYYYSIIINAPQFPVEKIESDIDLFLNVGDTIELATKFSAHPGFSLDVKVDGIIHSIHRSIKFNNEDNQAYFYHTIKLKVSEDTLNRFNDWFMLTYKDEIKKVEQITENIILE